MSKRELTIRPKSKENVFGCLPWIAHLPKSNGLCEGKVRKSMITHRPCKNPARWVYVNLAGDAEYVCFSHLHTGHLERDDEQERLEKWKKQVGYYELGNEQLVEEES